jgi:hypothetical protein
MESIHGATIRTHESNPGLALAISLLTQDCTAIAATPASHEAIHHPDRDRAKHKPAKTDATDATHAYGKCTSSCKFGGIAKTSAA